MSDDLIALARRAVACKAWRWMPGMLALPHKDEYGETTLDGWRVREEAGIFGGVSVGHFGDGSFVCNPAALPDLTDACTLGGLLALVREALDYRAHTSPLVSQGPTTTWCCYAYDAAGDVLHRFLGTEAEALVAALESAP